MSSHMIIRKGRLGTKDELKVLWKGSGPNGSWNDEEMSRVDRMLIWHISKALPGHGG